MPFEDRIRHSVDLALAQMRARLEQEVRAIVQQVINGAANEREKAVAQARQDAFDEAAAEVERQMTQAESRVRGRVEQAVMQARAEERQEALAHARLAIAVEAEEKLSEALAAAEKRYAQALAEAERRANDFAGDSVTAARVGEREAELSHVSRLLDGIRALDAAGSMHAILDALGDAVAREAPRAAVLMIRSERLIGWKLSGFGVQDSQPRSIELDVNEAGVLSLAITSHRTATTRENPAAGDPRFAELPADRMGLAIPVLAGGRVAAVVYADGFGADDQEQMVPSGWPEAIEILTRHASRCLDALNAQRSTTTPRFWVPPTGKSPSPPTEEALASVSKPTSDSGRTDSSVAQMQADQALATPVSLSSDTASDGAGEQAARKLARILLSDIKLFHRPAMDEGRRSRNLLWRLGPEIERVRRIYDARVPVALENRAEVFHQELVATLAAGDPSLLGFPV